MYQTAAQRIRSAIHPHVLMNVMIMIAMMNARLCEQGPHDERDIFMFINMMISVYSHIIIIRYISTNTKNTNIYIYIYMYTYTYK